MSLSSHRIRAPTLVLGMTITAVAVLLLTVWGVVAATATTTTLPAQRRIPNLVHFVYGMKEQTEPFCFVAYVAILSAFLVNEPEMIFLHYHHLSYGPWFDAVQRDVPILRLVHVVELPAWFGAKPILKTAHRADAVRMEVLRRQGGVYIDMDTISVRPYHHLRGEEMVMGVESERSNQLCNAIMMSAPSGRFLRKWEERYEEAFVSDGWGEASVDLPGRLSQMYPSLISVVAQKTFFWPSWYEVNAIFVQSGDIADELLILHLWDTFSQRYTAGILDWSWAAENAHTLYGKLLQHVWGMWAARRKRVAPSQSFGPSYFALARSAACAGAEG